MAGPGSNPGAGAASVPQGPMHEPAKKGGGAGLIIGLAVLAVLLIGGGITAYVVTGKPKPVPTGTLADLGSAATAPVESGSAGTPPADVDAAVATADPLGSTTTTPAIVKTGTGTATTRPTATVVKPVPTPTPKPDPPICATARAARAKKNPAAAALEAQCRAQGGTP